MEMEETLILTSAATNTYHKKLYISLTLNLFTFIVLISKHLHL